MSNNYGSRYYNDSGVVTIDSNFVTLAVSRSGSFGYYWPVTKSTPDPFHGVRAQVTYSSPITSVTPPIVAFLPRGIVNGLWHAFCPTGGPGNWTGFEVSFMETISGMQQHKFIDPTSLPLWDYAAANMEGCPYSDETYGERIWDENGKLIFDSGVPVIKLLGVVGGWTRLSSAPQWRRYSSSWPYPVGQNYGFIASNLPMQVINASYTPSVSPRFGFTQAEMAAGQISCLVGGSDFLGMDAIYSMIDAENMPDDLLPNWLAQNPIQLFAVQVD